MKKIIKITVSGIVAIHIMPFWLIFYLIVIGKIDEYGYLYSYSVGLIANVGIALLFGVIILLRWCFNWDNL